MSGEIEEQQYSTFLFVIGEWGREIFNTFTWNKKTRDGVETEEDDLLVKALFQKFEDYCLPKKNLIVERRRFFTRNQQHDETIDACITQLRNLSSPWISRCQKRINLVQTVQRNTKQQDTRYKSKKRSRFDIQKGNRCVQSRWNNQLWDEDYKTRNWCGCCTKK